MTAVLEPSKTYMVRVDHSTLKASNRGVGGARYSVRLTEPVDDRWTRCFNLVRVDSTGFARFRLDRDGCVGFTLRSNEGPAEIIAILERLDVLTDLVNRHACAESAIELE